MELETNIEALLFYKGESEHVDALARFFEVSKDDIQVAIKALENRLAHTGLTLIHHNDMVTLTTTSKAAPIIEKIRTEELSKDIGKAGIETLAIVLYKGPVTRADIDYIRGVNSSYILRNLLVRGLVERKKEEGRERVPAYIASTELLAYLGVTSLDDLPEYTHIQSELEAWTRHDTPQE
jgi:segregation and condensation protein B